MEKTSDEDEICIEYKSMIRPCMEYGSEICGDASETRMRQLDSVEQKAMTTCLVINRLASREKVWEEAKVEPLRERRKRKNIKTIVRTRKTTMFDYLTTCGRKRLRQKRRSSFIERVEKSMNEIGINWKKLKETPQEEIKDLERKIENKKNKKVGEGYVKCGNSRKMTAIWHQARTGTLSINKFLNKIGKSDSDKCSCGEEETLEHII